MKSLENHCQAQNFIINPRGFHATRQAPLIIKKDVIMHINEDQAAESIEEQAVPQKEEAELTSVHTIPDHGQAEKSASMQELFGAGVQVRALQPGDIVEGILVSVGKREIYVDIPGYGIGIIRGRELMEDQSGAASLAPGGTVVVSVVETENQDGIVELSLRKAGHERAWQQLQKMLEDREIVSTKIVGANKGGLMVTLCGVSGFLPVSQLTLEHYPRVEDGDKQKILQALQRYIGQNFTVQVITANQAEDKMIVSEKAAYEQETEARLSQIKIGDTVRGTVTGVVDFGVFIRFGELEGLAHISELAWQRVEHPKDKFQVGQEVEAKVIGLDKGRVSLSIKQMQTDPWQESIKQYKIGQVVEGKVAKLLPFGAFIELQKDVQGLAHIAELSHTAIKHPEEVLKVGEMAKFKIIAIEPANHRIGLSLKALQDKPKGEATAETPAEIKE